MQQITIHATINAPIAQVWEFYTKAEHVVNWNNASPDWHTPTAKNDLRVGGRFNYRMEAKDKSMGFDFEGVYTTVRLHERIAYEMPDKRKVDVSFTQTGTGTKVTVIFDPETQNSLDMQRQGWQSILDNFKKYVESH